MYEVSVCIYDDGAQTQGLGMLCRALYHCAVSLALGFFETGFPEAQVGLEFVVSCLSFLSAGLLSGMHPYTQPEYLIACFSFRILNAVCMILFVTAWCHSSVGW